MSRFFIESYGCQMNTAEANALEALLVGAGWEKAESPEEADLAVINTCSVRQSAENRIWGRLGSYTPIKKKKKLTLVLTGCMADRLGESIKKDAPQVDHVVPVNDKLRILEIAGGARATSGGAEPGDKETGGTGTGSDGALYGAEKYEFTKTYWKEGEFSSYVPIMNGCNNFCTYCIVPYVRGREVSRKPDEILDEVRFLDSKGVKEITLLGQNVNSYTYGNMGFPDLLKEVCRACSGIEWVRFESPHPKDFSAELIEVLASEPKAARHLHIPMQSGSTRILGLMNRRYTREGYLDLISRIKSRISDMTFAVDVMVGFPGETEAEFEETLSALKEVGYIEAYMYYWNPREGTKACEMEGQLSEREKQERLQRLIDFQLEEAARIKAGRAHGVQRVLALSGSRDNKNQMLGRNLHNESVVFDTCGTVRPGDMVNVELMFLNGNTYVGRQASS